MRLVKYELKKLFGTPVFLVILLLLIAANAVYAENITRLNYLEQYNAIHSDLSSMTEEEKNAYIAEKLAILDFAYEIQRFSEMTDSFEGDSDAAFQAAIDGKSEEFVKETVEAMENGTLTKYYPGNIRSEFYLFSMVSEAMASTHSYETYVKDVLKRASFVYFRKNEQNLNFKKFQNNPLQIHQFMI